MICPNCNQETERTITFQTKIGPLTACLKCPKVSPQTVEVPLLAGQHTKSESVRPERKRNFDAFKLSEEDIKRTQELRPRTRIVDNDLQRKISDVDLQNQGKIAVVMVGGDGKMRMQYAEDQIRKKIRGNYNIIFDNGMKIVAEAVA